MSRNSLKLIGISLSLILILSGCISKTDNPIETSPESTLPEVEVMEVSFNSIRKINITGEVTAAQSSNLSAEFKADVQAVFKKPGDTVTAGEVILLLDSESIQQSLSTAQQSLNNTQQSLSQTYASTAKNIESARVAMETAQTSYDNLLIQNAISITQAEEALNSAKLNLDLSSASAQTGLETAQKSLEKIKELNASSEQTARDSLANTINSIDANIVSVINTTDQILGISAIYEDAAKVWAGNLGALDKQTKSTAETSLKRLINTYESYNESYENAKSILELADQTLADTLAMLKKSTTGNNYSQTTLNTNITSVTGQITSTQGLLTGLISAKNGLDQTLASNASSQSSAEQGVISAQKSLDLTLQSTGEKSQSIINAEAQYEATLTQLETAEDTAYKQLESAKIAYESAQKGADLSATSAQAGVTNAQGGFEQARINQEKLLIKAPFDGTIVDIPVKTGDEVNPGTPLVQIENTDILKIIAYLTPEQSNQLKIGDTVKIATQSQDQISAISSTIDPVIKKNKIEILHQNRYLHSGQTVPLIFTISSQTSDKEGRVLVPMIAIHITGSEEYVWLVNSANQTEKRSITTGEINGSQISITSGLKEGDKIIVKGGRLFKKDGESVKIVQ